MKTRFYPDMVSMIGIATILVTAGNVLAVPTSFTDGTSTATFDFVGGDLRVTLANDSGEAASVPQQVLTGIFFSGADGLTPVSATLPSGSLVWLNGSSSSGSGLNVGGEWAYADGLAGMLPGGGTAGISSTGINLFGNPNFNGSDLFNPLAVGGLDYGLVSAAYAGGGNTGVTKQPVVSDSTVFLLSGFNGSLGDIGNVYFQYGTALNETSVPDGGSTIALLGVALLCVSLLRRRIA